MIAETTVVENNGELDQFDAMWISSLCDSTAKGKPDIELVDMTSRFRTIDDVTEVTTKPIIFDGDTGGLTEHFVYTVRSLEKMGVSAIIIEDKIGLKKNSLFGNDVIQSQDSIENFCAKIGAGIMIHSRKKTPDEILQFCEEFRKNNKNTPIVVVPTTYNSITEDELQKAGVNIVIYANQLTRSAFPAMEATAKDILRYHRSLEADKRLMSIKEIINLIDPL